MNKPYSSSASPLPNTATQLAPGVVIGGVIADKYRIERAIGRGGMGLVVAASHLALDRRVAIKLIRDEWGQDPMAVPRLLREAKAAASIQSEHVARVLDVGTLDDGVPFIVMEYLEGKDLDTLLRENGPLAVGDAIDYILQACEALAEAHRNGIVHRDLKPANVFVARQPGGMPCVKVVDFGISKVIGRGEYHEVLTHPSHIVGTLYHMAPEQMCGEPIDARTDVWAIGALLFEMLTGRKPYREGFWPEVCAQVLNPVGPAIGSAGDGVPKELEAVIHKCMRRSANERYSNVAELAVALVPFGKSTARQSLERIVRLATSTGSLAAELCTPAPPPDLKAHRAPLTSPEPANSLDPAPSEPNAEESMVTRKPVPAPVVAAASTSLRLARGATVLGALTIAGTLLVLVRPQTNAPAIAVQRLSPAPLPSENRGDPPAELPPSAPASLPGAPASEPVVTVLQDAPAQPVRLPSVPEQAPPGGGVAGGPAAAPPAPGAVTSGRPAPASVGSSVAPSGAPPASATPRPEPSAASASVAPKATAPATGSSEIIRELPEAAPPTGGVLSAAPVPVPPAAPAAEAPNPGVEAPSEPAPNLDPWDLSGVGFKRKPKESP
jgi:eukaryotic-like serine/threonine-protein kinase